VSKWTNSVKNDVVLENKKMKGKIKQNKRNRALG
jgi:hypothetical protein